METLDAKPDTAPVPEIRHRTLSAKFGDGYEQAAGDGINTKVQRWPLTFSGSKAEILAIQDFLDRHGGWKRFLWTPPTQDAPIAVRAPAYSPVSQAFNVYTLSVTLEQAGMV